MIDFHATLAELRRPKLLIRTARIGLAQYRRERDLQRLIKAEMPPQRALPRLLEEEEKIEEVRRKGDGSYSASHHVEVLIALMGEAQMLPRTVSPAGAVAAAAAPGSALPTGRGAPPRPAASSMG